MKIDQLIIDGFKSYAARTVISDWDSQFNAITGLNGSGKSNILDAICFVLGISSMSTVRASSLQDLIYKRGQAGVTKASVIIVFDNSDKSKSPIGFTDCDKISITRQIVMGGGSKYLINGHRAQQQTVLQLFQSVQLNINNPNFLIMQGKITKVLNMPPAQILALIAEAAGTKLFEDRREKAVKTMARKDSKLVEIKSLLAEEIEPKLEKLRREKSEFLEFQQTQSELDKLVRIVAAYDYSNVKKQHADVCEQFKKEKQAVQTLNNEVQSLSGALEALNEDLNQAKETKEKELTKSGKLETLEKHETDLSNQIIRLGTSKKMKEEQLLHEQETVKSAQNTLQQLEKEHASSSAVFTKLDQAQEAAKAELASFKLEISNKEELLASLQTGVSSKGNSGGYMSHVQDAKQQLADCEVSIEQTKMKINRLNSELAKEHPAVAKAEKEVEEQQKQLESLRLNTEKMQEKMKAMGFDPRKLKSLKDNERTVQQQIYQISNQLEALKRNVTSLEFNYTRPSADFDARSVKGVAAKLITLDADNFDSATALEVAAGGKLYNIVVDNEVTASQLLEKGRLRKRVTIIPLNKISSWQISAKTVDLAKKLCPGKVELALNLVGYEDEVNKAMEYIFGGVFITKDPETSKTITFNPQIRARSVTLEGDVYDPSGTLSGGSRKQSNSVFITVQKYNKLSQELQDLQQQMQQIRQQIAEEEKLSQTTMSLQKQANLAGHSYELAVKKLKTSSASAILEKEQIRITELQELSEKIAKEQAHQTILKQKLLSVEKDMKEFEANKGSKLGELEKEVKTAKKRAVELEKFANDSFSKWQEAQFDIEKLTGDIDAAKEQAGEAYKLISELTKEIGLMEQELSSQKEAQSQVAQSIAQEKATMLGINKEINELTKHISAKTKSLNDKKLQTQRLSHDLEKTQNSVEKLSKRMESLESENEWVTDENMVANIIQQSPNVDVQKCQVRINNLQSKFQGMKRKVNANIMSMIDNVEKKETSLKTMIQTIEKDKTKINETIETLDEYKRETLVKTWKKVSKDFGNIFADLLPGAFAKLVIPEAKDITEGLEVKVMLGKVWKESLVELSGGQRSLVALSLIMALLQFKPAPMYILDEVDAALDLSHTQNIGHLIKTRFKGSQFIVVSLKEGMFTNANRVFRTRFQDGTSVVSMM